MIESRKTTEMKHKLGSSDYDPMYQIETSVEKGKQVDGDKLWKIPY